VDLDIAAKRAILGRGAGIPLEAGFRVEGRDVVETAVAAVELVVGTNFTGDLEAGVGARNVEEALTELGADPYVFDRFRPSSSVDR